MLALPRLFSVLLLVGSLLPATLAIADDSQPKNTVLWISLDGFRSDYLARVETPFFDHLRAHGAWSDEVWPSFPAVTFTSHVSLATGVPPQKHGITGNSFYDNRTGKIHRYPGANELLEAEPIWITASRQGIRSAVLDWPLAHDQTGPVTAAYFGEAFEGDLTDAQRLHRILDLWEEDDAGTPLQLLLGYTTSPDREGHRYGPEAPEVDEAVNRVDQLLADVFQRATRIWEEQKQTPNDRFYLVVTSDHGMSKVTTLVHPEKLTGLDERNDVVVMTTGNIAHLHLDKIANGKERTRLIGQTLARLSEFDFVRAYRREEIPEAWALRHPYRTGDIFLVLQDGYAFNRRASGITSSVEETGGPHGMHGYDPADTPAMLTPLFIFRHPEPLGGKNLGPIHSLQLHATIARLLGIEPAPEAVDEAIRLP